MNVELAIYNRQLKQKNIPGYGETRNTLDRNV